MTRATLRFLLGLFILLSGASSRALAHQIPFGVLTSSAGAQQLSSESNFHVIQAAQTFISKSTSPGSGEEKQSFESSLFEKEEEDKSCSFNTITSVPQQILICYAGVLSHFQQMVQERLHVHAYSRLLMTSNHTALLQKFQI